MNKITTLFFICVLITISLSTKAQVDVLTQRNDPYRTGWNSSETILNSGNVKPASFGKLFTRSVDDQIYAQPLVATGVSIPGAGIRNVVYVATVNNTIYAFDAENSAIVNPYWSKNLSPGGSRPPNINDIVGPRCINFSGNFGIVGSPVIDKNSKTLYVVARTVIPGTPTVWQQYLHAIDITNGLEKPGSPVLITASITGTGDGQVNGVVGFNPATQNQRPGLLLLNGIVYIGYASHCDYSPYHGWLLGYDSATLQQKIVYNDTPDGGLGGIWMSGAAPAADELGNIYVATGNGTVGVGTDPTSLRNRGESLLKLTHSGNTLQVSSYFTPKNYGVMNANDLDFGPVQVLLIPTTKLAMSGSKEGLLFLVNRDNMGGFNATTNNVIQTVNLGSYANLHASLGYYRGIKNEFVYAWSENAALTALPFNRVAGNFNLSSTVSSSIQGPSGQTGAFLSTTSNGPNDSTGILWGVHASGGCDAETGTCHGILHAIDANNVKNELWNSTMNSADDPGNLAKFVSPTVANGKVYMATFSHQLVVYGIKSVPLTVTAGGNHSIILPSNSLTLSGTATRGTVGGPIVSYNWSQRSGPNNSTLLSANTLSSQALGLVSGNYIFRLTVRDSSGAIAMDSSVVTVFAQSGSSINVRLYAGSFPYQNSLWNNWNVGTGLKVNSTSGILKYSDGSTSPINAILSYQDDLSDNGALYTTGATMCPDTVLRFTSYSTSTRTLTINGLSNSNKYNIELYASRNRTDGQKTNFVIGNQSITVSTDINTANAAMFSAITPSNGSISITISKSAVYNYLNGFKITGNLLNSPPMVSAGGNQTITAPVNSVNLMATATKGGGGPLVSTTWSELSGPNSATITSPGSLITSATNLVLGTYQFKILAKDSLGSSASSTTQVIVQPLIPPRVVAGGNQTITLPTNSTKLSGTEIQGNAGGPLVSPKWIQKKGPNIASIVSPNSLTTQVNGLVAGNYVFELDDVDSIGEPASDSSVVTVTTANNQVVNVRFYEGAFPFHNPSWNNWNIGIGPQVNKSSGILKYSDGSASTLQALLSYQDNMADNGGTYASGATICPDTVLRFASYTTSYRTLTVSGLNNAKKYDLEFYASRYRTDGQNTSFTIGNLSSTVPTDINTSLAAKFSAISPSNGSIAITINRTAIYNYLNGFKISENTASQALGLDPIDGMLMNNRITRENNIWKVQIFPNPFTDNLNLLNNSSNPVKVQVFDISGRQLILYRNISNLHEIDMHQLVAGTYIILVTDERTSQVFRKKIIKY